MGDNDQLTFMYGNFSEDMSDDIGEEFVTIRREEYEELLAAAGWLDALEAAGVDNWDGIDFAREILDAFD